MAPRDENYVSTALATDENDLVKPIELDTSSNRLLIELVAVANVTKGAVGSGIDANRVRIAMGVDNVAATPQPLLVDVRNGGLWADVTFE